MSFELEREMSGIILDSLPGCLGLGRFFAYGFEVPLDYRQVDLGLVSIPRSLLETEMLAPLKRMTLREVWDLSLDISVVNSAHAKSSRKHPVNWIKRAGGLKLTADLSEEVLTQILAFATSEEAPLVFIEFKLRDWKGALAQAQFCFRAAPLACVVMDGDASGKVPLDAFASHRVGLFAAWEDRLEPLVLPTRNPVESEAGRVFHRLRVLQDLAGHARNRWQVTTSRVHSAPCI